MYCENRVIQQSSPGSEEGQSPFNISCNKASGQAELRTLQHGWIPGLDLGIFFPFCGVPESKEGKAQGTLEGTQNNCNCVPSTN